MRAWLDRAIAEVEAGKRAGDSALYDLRSRLTRTVVDVRCRECEQVLAQFPLWPYAPADGLLDHTLGALARCCRGDLRIVSREAADRPVTAIDRLKFVLVMDGEHGNQAMAPALRSEIELAIKALDEKDGGVG